MGELARRIAAGDISATEVVEATLEHAIAEDSTLRCFREIEAEAARSAAATADRRREKGQALGPLHGIPLAHKDIFDRSGEHCDSRLADPESAHAGIQCLRHYPNAASRRHRPWPPAVGRICHEPDGIQRPYSPRPKSLAYRLRPGGSSMGSGAAVAARLVFGSLGTDTGGSVRHPAAVCGVVGIKPTQGRVSRHGVFPLAESLDCPGVLARTARDAALMLQVIAGRDPQDASSSSRTVANYGSMLDGDIRGLRIGIPRQYYYAVTEDGIDANIHERLEQSLKVLRSRGATVKTVDVIDMHSVNQLARTVFCTEAAAVHKQWLDARPLDYSDQVRARIAAGQSIAPSEYREALRIRKRVSDSFVSTSLSQVDVLHTPCVAVPTPTLKAVAAASLEEAPHQIERFTHCTRAINYLGLPAISVPCGFVGEGLPVAFQLVGRPFDEGLLLRVADAYQRESDWHRRIPPVVSS